MENSIFFNERTTDKNLIESILYSFYILDYGFVKEVNADGTLDVTHAKVLKGYNGDSLKATVTNNVEVLTVCGVGFSFKFDIKKGDKVLLLGLKDYIKKVEEVSAATETNVYMHYSRETLKAIPMCVFNEDAKVKIEVEGGTLKATTDKKIELNGNDKQFVTWQELDDALQQLWTSIQSHTHPAQVNTGTGSGTAAASVDLQSVTLDISAAKTKTVVTGG